ncbi:hypothetical protein ACQP2P_16125 [Dactylosporangium sp. CA-139114]|uniref:hypothetical protein n=1 Tax=Dactylosporangium sp. CA-139114 TaxID=3239931 RepID=UPI003D99D4B4
MVHVRSVPAARRPGRASSPRAEPGGLADVVTLQRRARSGSSPQDEQALYQDSLAEYTWARDVAGLAGTTLQQLIRPVIEVCDFYECVPWQLTPGRLDQYFVGPGRRAPATMRKKLLNIDSYFAFLEQRYAGEIMQRFGAAVVSPVDTFNRPRHRGDFGLRVPPSRRAMLEFFAAWRAALPQARKYHVAVRDYVMAKIAYLSGVRAAELCAVRIGDVHWELGQWGRFVVRGKGARGSGPRERMAFLFAEGRELLWWYVEQIRGEFRDDPEDMLAPLWPSERLPAAPVAARAHRWPDRARRDALRVLRLIASWLGTAAPIRRSDVVNAAREHRAGAAARVVQFLATHGLLIDDRQPRTDAHERAARRLQAAVPPAYQADVATWTQSLRTPGPHGTPPRSWAAVHIYLHHTLPVLIDWAPLFPSLTAITRDDIDAALAAHPRGSIQLQRTGLRSLFQALRHRRRIFTDPTRNVRGRHARPLVRPIPSDRLRGLLDRVPNTMARAVVALVALHALQVEELRDIRLDHLDRVRWRLTIHRRGGRTHHLVIDETTKDLIGAWLRERMRRWPTSTNPYLFVTRLTALDPLNPQISRTAIVRHFPPLGLGPAQLRADRILYEATQSADPLMLMRLFGLSKSTAMHYLAAAAPAHGRDPIMP